MAINLTPGEIYFIREQDVLTKEISDYVKVGLVREGEDRDSDERASEHQTGNPRELSVYKVVKTAAVSMNRIKFVAVLLALSLAMPIASAGDAPTHVLTQAQLKVQGLTFEQAKSRGLINEWGGEQIRRANARADMRDKALASGMTLTQATDLAWQLDNAWYTEQQKILNQEFARRADSIKEAIEAQRRGMTVAQMRARDLSLAQANKERWESTPVQSYSDVQRRIRVLTRTKPTPNVQAQARAREAAQAKARAQIQAQIQAQTP